MTGTPIAPVVVAHNDADPSPRVDVTLAVAPADAVTVTLYRVAEGQRTAVRGALRIPSASPLVTDYEAPIGVPITYLAEAQDINGTPSQLGPASAVVTLVSSGVWLSDPLAPRSAVLVHTGPGGTSALAGSFARLTHASAAQTIDLPGSPLPVGVGGLRRAPSGIPLVLYTETPQAAAQLSDLLAQAFPLLVRTPELLRFLPRAAYVSVADLEETPLRRTRPTLNYDRTRWDTVLKLVQPPSASVVLPTRTWDDVAQEAATWDQLAQRYATWADVARG